MRLESLVRICGFFLIVLSQYAVAQEDDYILIWRKDMLSQSGIHEIGRSWSDIDALRFDGTRQWISSCPWDGQDSIPIPPSQWGYNSAAQSHLEIGDRIVTPRPIKFRSNPGRGIQQDTLTYSHALQTANEVVNTFPNKKGRLTISFTGHVDRCPNRFGPAMTSAPNLDRRYVKFKLRCNNADEFQPNSSISSGAAGIWNARLEIWADAAKASWPAVENKYVHIEDTIDFDTSSCDSEMYLTATVYQEERLTLDAFEVLLWSL